MRGEATKNILEILEDAALSTADVLEMIVSLEYGASLGKMKRRTALIHSRREKERNAATADSDLRRKYQKKISFLKKDGLIEAVRSSDGSFKKDLMRLTKDGVSRLGKLRLMSKNSPNLPNAKYPHEIVNSFTIIAFDIPERDRFKRRWLREVLKNMSFRMIQQSVWFGRVRIPQRLIDDLKRLDLLDCVEIFEVSKQGTLVNRSKE